MFSEALKARVGASLLSGELPCAGAFKLAEELGLKPMIIGQVADEMDVHLSRCQLGLFGYGPKAEGKHRVVKPMADVPAELQQAIEAVAADKGLTCLQAWEIAADLGLPKMDVCSACETLGFKITVCQLGAFPRPKPWS
jgi:hypothetical protein